MFLEINRLDMVGRIGMVRFLKIMCKKESFPTKTDGSGSMIYNGGYE
jgi:hypothetical protein